MLFHILFGTRPEIIKLAPLIKTLPQIAEVRSLATGQHSELIKPVLQLFDISVDYQLACADPDLLNNFFSISKALKQIWQQNRPNLIIVQGDTLTTFAGAFTAFMCKIPVIHLEAGLRSGNKFAPYPEEAYRIMVDKLADIFLAPTISAYKKLLAEGEKEDRIFLVGNTVVDALEMAMENINPTQQWLYLSETLKTEISILQQASKVLITAHRRENIGEPLADICKAILHLTHLYPEVLFIWALHKNPAVRKIIFSQINTPPPNLFLVEALPYATTLFLMQQVDIILTDSGGIQEEAPTFKKPILILREVTERNETVEYGFGFLVGTHTETIIRRFQQIWGNKSIYQKLELLPNPYGDGKTTQRIMQLLACPSFEKFIKNYTQEPNMNLQSCKKAVECFAPQLIPYCGVEQTI
ncbi:MAG: UDP-N-acetylglucosamine 2-epimerase (non-hydrolyzing) [Bacteroidia bacterium]|nr:UDP-N-acetylglucosamine 2-epimerase (non-hydrolyzing) [Bacteroidia bacterium]